MQKMDLGSISQRISIQVGRLHQAFQIPTRPDRHRRSTRHRRWLRLVSYRPTRPARRRMGYFRMKVILV